MIKCETRNFIKSNSNKVALKLFFLGFCLLIFPQANHAQVNSSVDSIEIKITIPNIFVTGSETDKKLLLVQKLDSSELQKFEWKVYNRWGQLVFESTKIDKGWDGAFNGKPLANGVFLYKLKMDVFDKNATIQIKNLSYNGSITLVR